LFPSSDEQELLQLLVLVMEAFVLSKESEADDVSAANILEDEDCPKEARLLTLVLLLWVIFSSHFCSKTYLISSTPPRS
jgi:hypothetical protein